MEPNICPRCGTNNSELARFCYACGMPLTCAENATAPQAAEPIDTAYQTQEWSDQQSAQSGNGQVPPVDYTQQPYQHPGNYQTPPQYQPYGAQQPTQQPGSYQMPPQGMPHQPNPYQMPPQGYPPYGQPYQQPFYQPATPFAPLGYRQKSKVAAGILGILLGVFGVHNFYLGYTGKAVAQLLISILSGFTLSVIPFIWGMIEGIMILCGRINLDGRNVPLSD